MTSRSSGPQYAKLAQDLIARIESGRLRVGDRLPTEQEMCEQFGVSRITVRSALAELERRGLVLRRPRVGTTVLSDRTQPGFVHAGDSIPAILNFTRDLPFALLTAEEVSLGAAEAAACRLAKGLRMLRVTGVRGKPGMPPPIYSVHLIPILVAPPPRQLDGLSRSIPEWLAERHGEQINELEQSIDVSRLDATAARALESRTGTPALRTQRWYRFRNGGLVIMARSWSPEGRYSISSTLRREPSG